LEDLIVLLAAEGREMSPGNAQRETWWRDAIRRQKLSGLSIAQFCRKEGIAQASFYNWRKKLADHESSPFLEIRLPTLNHAKPCEIVLPHCRVVVPPGFDPDSLRQLLLVLRQENPTC
jgi:hypothetical protein